MKIGILDWTMCFRPKTKKNTNLKIQKKNLDLRTLYSQKNVQIQKIKSRYNLGKIK